MKRPRKVSQNDEEQGSDEIASEVAEDSIDREDDEAVDSEPNTDNEENDATDTEPTASSTSQPPVKKRKRGIIYLSTIPKHMTVAIAREMFSQYAEIGRMFFQPETKMNGLRNIVFFQLQFLC